MFYLRADRITRKVMLQALNSALKNDPDNGDYQTLKDWLLELKNKDN